jgi:MoaA/NifB/PqqE/SkfB family radical SAM enzyme
MAYGWKEPKEQSGHMLKKILDPRLPLEGRLDLTYRCNNNCLHCWLKVLPEDPVRKRELSFDRIRRIVDESRALGTRQWSISGGEPMLRPDFPEIFEYVTAKAVSYALNTNGTLITPKIAGLLKRRGSKMVSLYGATKETYDHVTRNPGGFEQLMQGFRYLREAGAGFIVQLVPMKDNWHEWERMIELARSLSGQWRIGAPWLYLSSCRNPDVNARISGQRLDPRDVVRLDRPDLSFEESDAHRCGHTEGDGRLFADCIARRRDFHIDPYGTMSFCSFLKEPSMRYDLVRGTVCEGWEEFIPSLASREFGVEEYRANCGSCDLRKDCRWCAVYGWLEHGRFSAPVAYLCEVARENRRFKDEWKANHRRFYRIAGITIRIESDLPFTDATFHESLTSFRTDGPGEDMVTIRHHFEIPDLREEELGRELYRRPPWVIFKRNGADGPFTYLVSSGVGERPLHRVATFSSDHTRVRIYNDSAGEERWRRGVLRSLTLFPSDNVFFARLLVDRSGCCIRSSGVIIDGSGMLFAGFGTGNAAVTNIPVEACPPGDAEIRHGHGGCHIVRRETGHWQVYGTWDNNGVPSVSASGVPLRAICFKGPPEKSDFARITDREEIVRRLLGSVVRPLADEDCKAKMFDLMQKMAESVPCYVTNVDGSREIVNGMDKLIEDGRSSSVS